MASDEISERASVLLKTLVERHIRDGQPVGSRHLLEQAGLPVSAATIRNVMSDLEDGLPAFSPYLGRPRAYRAGLSPVCRHLLQVQPLEQQAVQRCAAN